MSDPSYVDDSVPPPEPGDFVRVVNQGSVPFVLTYDSRKYILRPQLDSFIPFEAACLYFGDPRSVDTSRSVRNSQGVVQWVPDRRGEINRLRLRYNNNIGPGDEISGHPNVAVYDMGGQPISMVVHDPTGENVAATRTQSPDLDPVVIRATITQQQRLIDQLMVRLGLLESAPVDPTGIAFNPEATSPSSPPSDPAQQASAVTASQVNVQGGKVVGGDGIPEDRG